MRIPKLQFFYQLMPIIILLQILQGLRLVRASELQRGEEEYLDVNRVHEVEPSGMRYLGCYDVWNNNVTDWFTTNFFEDLTLEDCDTYCSTNVPGNPESLLFVRGFFCGCLMLEISGLVHVPVSLCDLECSRFASDTGGPRHPCGGNFAFSVYCNQNRNLCAELISEARNEWGSSYDYDSDETNKVTTSLQPWGQGQPLPSIRLTPCLLCFRCDPPEACNAGSFHVNLAYMPANSVEVCIKFCGNELDYFDKDYKTRSATKYATIGWGYRGSFQVSTCGCRDEAPVHSDAEEHDCMKLCPGNPRQYCGGEPPYYFGLYLTRENGDSSECLSDFASTTELPGTGTGDTTTISSTEVPGDSTMISTVTSSTKETDKSTEISSTTISSDFTSTTETTREATTSDSESESSGSPPEKLCPETTTCTDETANATMTVATTTIASSTIETETPTFSTTEGSGQQNPTELPCTLKCTEIDRHGKYWTACAGIQANTTCPRGASGYALWKCSAAGNFIGLPNYTHCVTSWIRGIEIGEDEVIPEDKANYFLNLINTEVANSTDNPANYFGHEIKEISEIVSKVLTQVEESIAFPNFENMTEVAVVISGNFLINKYLWEELSIENRSFVGTKLLQQIESNVFNLTSRSIKPAAAAEEKYRKSFPSQPGIQISAGAQLKSLAGSEGLQFPLETEMSDGSFIKLPDGWDQHVPGGAASNLNFIGMAIASDLIKQILPESAIGQAQPWETTSPANANKFMNGKLMSFSLAKPNGNMINFPDEGVKIKFLHDLDASLTTKKDLPRRQHEGEYPKAVFGSARCMFWDTTKLEWSSAGCQLVRSERSTTMCECSHLTAFAVLMDVHNYLGKDFALEIVTLVICPLSIVCLFVTILTFTFVRSTHGALTTITKNLCATLLVGNALVLFIVDRHYLNMSEDLCKASAIIVHYVFLTAFMWMAIQGYHLYKQMVHVFESGTSHMTIYRVFAFGVPILIVGSTGVIAYLMDSVAYGGEMFCWLQGYYIWTFMAPVAVICLANTVVLIITLRAAFEVRSRTNSIANIRVRSNKISIKGGLSITILLGLTWLSGFFLMTDDVLTSTITAYVFTLLNASQGIFLFVFHCLLNEKVRAAAARKNIVLPSWLSTSGGNWGSSRPESSESKKKSKPNVPNSSSASSKRVESSTKQRGNRQSSMYPRVQINPTLEDSFSSSNSNSSVKSVSGTASGNESAGSQTNLLYSARKISRK